MENFCIVVPWHRPEVRDTFLKAWDITAIPSWLLLEQDIDGIGCANMKNKLIHKAYNMGAEVIGVLDSDCHPIDDMNLQDWMQLHIEALKDQPVKMFEDITYPQSRGTPYYNKSITMPVAASIGFWDGVPDWDAPSQLVRGNEKMTFNRKTIYGKYFAFSGMNFAFNREWIDCAELIDVERMDDIWMGFLWQREAWQRRFCFNLDGPLIKHTRQTNVWNNLKIEAEYLQINETLWQKIALAPTELTIKQLRKQFFPLKNENSQKINYS